MGIWEAIFYAGVAAEAFFLALLYCSVNEIGIWERKPDAKKPPRRTAPDSAP